MVFCFPEKRVSSFEIFGLVGSDARPTGDQKVADSSPAGSGNFIYEIDHEIFSRVILSLLLIQEGQLSVSGERTCTSTG